MLTLIHASLISTCNIERAETVGKKLGQKESGTVDLGEMSLLDHYWTLASNDAGERLAAAEALIKGLEEKNSDEDWDYALNRLITGLSSSRGSARLGFAVALAGVLEARKGNISVQHYLDRATKAFIVTGGMKGPEERGLLLGKLFALQTLAASPLWGSASIEDRKSFFRQCIELAQRKTWLREPSFFALCDVLERLGDDKDTVDSLLVDLDKAGLLQTQEGLAVTLTVPLAYSNWDPLRSKELENLSKILRELPVQAENVPRSNWKVHFVWEKLLSYFASLPEASVEAPARKKAKKHSHKHIRLPEFWKAVIDEGFFASTASSERKMWGFQIFLRWLQELSDVRALLSPHLVHSFANQLAQNDRNLHVMSQKVATAMIEAAKQPGPKAADIVMGIILVSPNFDRVSKSRLLHTLMENVSEGQERVVTALLDNFEQEDELPRKQAMLDFVLQLVRMKPHGPMNHIILDRLAPLAYQEGAPEPVAKLVQDRIMSILSSAMGRGVNPGDSWPYLVLKKVDTSNLRVVFDDDTRKATAKAEATVDKIHTKRMSSRHVDSKQLQAFELLFAMVLLQVYTGHADAVSMLDELQLCYHRIALGEDSMETEDASQVFTEIMVSLLSQQSSLLRKLVEDVWGSFTDQISTASLLLLGDILQTPESEEGQNALFMISDDDDDDEASAEVDEETGDTVTEKPESDAARDAAPNPESDSELSDVEDGLDEEETARLRETLGASGSDSESMDDEQMTALDGQLSVIFRERKLKQTKGQIQKKEVAKAKRNVTLLKSRVLDILDIFVQRQPTNAATLVVVEPVVKLIAQTKDRQLADKSREFVRSRLCRRTSYELSSDQVESVLLLLQRVHEIAALSNSKLQSLACNQLGVFLTKLLLGHNSTLITQICNVYQESLVNWFANKKNQTMPGMFIDFVNFLGSKR